MFFCGLVLHHLPTGSCGMSEGVAGHQSLVSLHFFPYEMYLFFVLGRPNECDQYLLLTFPPSDLIWKTKEEKKRVGGGKKGKRKYFPCCCCCCIDIFKYSRPLGIKKKWREGCSCPSQTEKSAALTVVYQSILFFFGRVTAVAFNDFILVSGAYLMIWGAVLLPRPAFFPLFYSWKKKMGTKQCKTHKRRI